MSVVTRLLQDLFAPQFCAFCGRVGLLNGPWCNACYTLVQPVMTIELSLTRQRRLPVLAGGSYEGPLASLVRAKQIRDLVAARQLGMFLAAQLADWQQPVDYLIPVPLHWRRYAMRGFNQAEVMAQPLAAQWGAQVSPVLLRTRNTAYQASCTAEERAPNVQNAFSWALDTPSILEGKHLVLVDDLMTTGATLVSAARLLATMRPASLHAVVAARVV